MKENLKPCVYKLWKREEWKHDSGDRVLFVERSGELRWQARLSTGRCGAEGKPSLKRAFTFERRESARADPKPGDLSMSRMKLP